MPCAGAPPPRTARSNFACPRALSPARGRQHKAGAPRMRPRRRSLSLTIRVSPLSPTGCATMRQTETSTHATYTADRESRVAGRGRGRGQVSSDCGVREASGPWSEGGAALRGDRTAGARRCQPRASQHAAASQRPSGPPAQPPRTPQAQRTPTAPRRVRESPEIDPRGPREQHKCTMSAER